MVRRRDALVAALILSLGGPAASAQAPDSAARPPDPAPFFTRKDAYLAAGFTAGALGLALADGPLARTFQDPSLQESAPLRHGAGFFRWMAEPGTEIAALAVYVAGRFVLHDRRVAAIGLHGAESLLLSAAITGVVKGAAGRARPYVRADTVPFDFELGRGLRGRDWASFPSGHTSTAFAAASVVTAEMARLAAARGWAPGWKWLIGGVMYGGAGLVGVSRIYHDQHWASDVAAGAAIGTFSGLKVVSYSYRHPGNRAERWFLDLQVAPLGGGRVALRWSLPAPR